MDGTKILWKHLEGAYLWDQQNTVKYYQQLTSQHFQLDSASLMRTHLADQVLDKNMLSLFKVSFYSRINTMYIYKTLLCSTW